MTFVVLKKPCGSPFALLNSIITMRRAYLAWSRMNIHGTELPDTIVRKSCPAQRSQDSRITPAGLLIDPLKESEEPYHFILMHD